MEELVFSETLDEWTVHQGMDIKADRTTVVKAVTNSADDVLHAANEALINFQKEL